MTLQVLTNARVIGHNGLQAVEISNGLITAIKPMTSFLTQGHFGIIQNMQEDWISLGGVDLQINGALGWAFPDLEPGHEPVLRKIGSFLWQQGIDAFLPTLVTTALSNIHRALGVLRSAAQQPAGEEAQAAIWGAHLEGPCLNPAKRGAHPEAHLKPLSQEIMTQVLGDFAAQVRLVTLAPELDETGGAIAALIERGISVSLGHSLATAAQAQQAFNQGAAMVTHAFNAMPGLHHREPGLLGAAIAHPNVFCGFIADGQHVCPTMLDILLRTSRGLPVHQSNLSFDASRHHLPGLFLVSDALAPLGLPDGTYPWDERQIRVVRGTARLPDDTLSGTTLPLLEGVKNLVRWDLCSVPEAIALVTEAPRQALGRPGIGVGQPATLLRWRERDRQLTWQRLSV
ncbi:MAG: N-acetylglucosamine-6-phosphate deacetylase [Cyanobacteria bacterium P01_C01_bin.73]